MSDRPRLHLTAHRGWVSDPLAVMWRDGTYHAHYQYVPDQPSWAVHRAWGSATSPDLLLWTEGPPALSPGDGDDGCWSGSMAMGDDGRPLLFYTSVRSPDVNLGRVRVAHLADDTGGQWHKGAVVAEAPAEPALSHFRDPFLFRDGDRWRMLVGARLRMGSPAILGYSSADLHAWTVEGVFASADPPDGTIVSTGSLWVCPQFVRAGDDEVLLVSVWQEEQLHFILAAVGDRDGSRFWFVPRRWRRLSYGPSPYAMTTFRDNRGRPSALSWLRGVSGPAGTWMGALSFPALITVEAGEVALAPHPALRSRRGRVLTDGSEYARWTTGDCVDLEWQAPRSAELSISSAGAVTALRAIEGTLSVCLADGRIETMPRTADAVRVLLDGPVLEMFCGGKWLAAPILAGHSSARIDGGGGSLAGWALS